MSIQEYIETHNLSKRVEETINAAVKAKAPEPISFMVGRARACRVGFRRLRRRLFVCFFFVGCFPFSLLFCGGGVCSRREFFPFERKKNVGRRREEGGATTTTTKKRDVRFLEEFAERKRVVANERRWFGRVAVARSSAPARRRSWINSSFFFKRESAFEEWLTPQKRELFFRRLFPALSLSLSLSRQTRGGIDDREESERKQRGWFSNE